MVTGDERTLDLDELRAAVDGGELPQVVEQLVAEYAWSELRSVFVFLARSGRLPDLQEGAGVLEESLAKLSEGKRARAATAAAIAAVRQAAAEALLARTGEQPTTEAELRAARTAAALLRAAGEERRAARVFERAGDRTTAAELWAELGEIDALEAALAGDESRRQLERAARDALVEARALFDSGQRLAAAATAATAPEGALDSAAARALAARVGEQLVSGASVGLRLPGGGTVRLAALPVVLGRDGSAEVPLRDPGVSRRHALLTSDVDGIALEDAGSRAGTRLGGVLLGGRVPLRGEGEIGLGTAVLSFRELGSGRIELRGRGGLDRGLHAVIGAGPLPLQEVAPSLPQLSLVLDRVSVRLVRPAGVVVRIAGKLIGETSELLHGDRIDVDTPQGRLALEVL